MKHIINRIALWDKGDIMEMTASSNKSWKINTLGKLEVSFHKRNNKEIHEEVGGEFTVI